MGSGAEHIQHSTRITQVAPRHAATELFAQGSAGFSVPTSNCTALHTHTCDRLCTSVDAPRGFSRYTKDTAGTERAVKSWCATSAVLHVALLLCRGVHMMGVQYRTAASCLTRFPGHRFNYTTNVFGSAWVSLFVGESVCPLSNSPGRGMFSCENWRELPR